MRTWTRCLLALVVAAAVLTLPASISSATPDAVRAAVDRPVVPEIDGFLVNPYLSHPGTDRVSVMFEPETTSIGTTMAVEYRVAGTEEWQSQAALLEGPHGGVTPTVAVYRADITGLESNTVYDYRVVTGAGTTPAATFKTWPEEGDGVEGGRFLLMSDIQVGSYGGRTLDIFQENLSAVVRDYCGGVAAACSESIDAIVVPGDLVGTGGNIDQWRNEWFAPADFLFRYVPAIPAVGNHDTPIGNYVSYYDAPSNGQAQYEEQWHAYDFLNLKLITMQSSVINTASAQLQNDFLAAELDEATANGQDYVITQFHHPCKSELWLPGESSYACGWVRQLEDWSEETGNFSGHLFGHTHAYSRGQSRDVPHMWLNVAGAAGAIDDWGHYEMADYDEMAVTWDEHGYQMMDFTAAGTPETRLVRHTAGDDFGYYEDRFTPATDRDQLTIGGDNAAPDTPQPRVLQGGFGGGDTGVSGPVTVRVPDPILHAPYRDADDETLYEAHWQVRAADGSYDEPMHDVWGTETRAENIWFRDNINGGIDNDYWRVPALDDGDYCYRVRHRDEHWSWSSWSEDLCFTVAGVTSSDNLVVNGGAEDGTVGWESDGPLNSSGCEGSYEGSRHFVLGGCGAQAAWVTATQDIDVTPHAADIDAGRSTGVLRAALRDWNGWDIPTIRAIALDAEGSTLDITRPLVNQTPTWEVLDSSVLLPPGTRTVRIMMTGQRQQGADNDSYIDDVRFTLATSDVERAPYDRPCASLGNGMGVQVRQDTTYPTFGACGDWNDPLELTVTGEGPFASEPLFEPGGEPERVVATVYNPSLDVLADVTATLDLPDGWTAEAIGEHPGTVGAARRATFAWHVTAPLGAQPGEALATISGTRDGEALEGTATIGLAVSPTLTGNLIGETFDGLADLLRGGVEHNGTAGSGVLGWTQETPDGWTITNADEMPQGTTEMQGWSFMTIPFWAHGDDQARTTFGLGVGVIAVADPDEWDDVGNPDARGRFDSTLSTPTVDLVDGAEELTVEWDNHYRQEEPMEAEVVVEFDDGTRTEIVHWGPTEAETPGTSEMNNHQTHVVAVPAGATTARVHFRVFNAMNDWYWAIDNVEVHGPEATCGDRTAAEWDAAGFNVIVGTDGADELVGTNEADVIFGLGGADTLVGGNAEDVLCGGAGDDVLHGGNGRDMLFGGSGDDVLHGGNGGDELHGGPGADVLDGGRGKDREHQD